MRKAVSIFLFMLFVAGAAHAATFDRVTDRDLLDHADLVVVARVLDSQSHEAAGRDIFTDSRLQIEEVVKGSVAGDTITVSQLGANGQPVVLRTLSVSVPQAQ